MHEKSIYQAKNQRPRSARILLDSPGCIPSASASKSVFKVTFLGFVTFVIFAKFLKKVLDIRVNLWYNLCRLRLATDTEDVDMWTRFFDVIAEFITNENKQVRRINAECKVIRALAMRRNCVFISFPSDWSTEQSEDYIKSALS